MKSYKSEGRGGNIHVLVGLGIQGGGLLLGIGDSERDRFRGG